MKNLVYLFAALVMMTSCTLSEEDTPQPYQNNDNYETYEAADNPSHIEEPGNSGGQGHAAQGFRAPVKAKNGVDAQPASSKYDQPDADQNISIKTSVDENPPKRKVTHGQFSKVKTSTGSCPMKDCIPGRPAESAPSQKMRTN